MAAHKAIDWRGPERAIAICATGCAVGADGIPCSLIVKTRDPYELAIFALVEPAAGRAIPIAGATSAELRPALKKHADTKSKLMTDEWSAYKRPGREFASHKSISHSEDEWTRGEVHTHSIELSRTSFRCSSAA